MKIVILDSDIANPGDLSWEGLEKLGELVVYDDTPDELRAQRIGDADAVIVNKVPLGEDTFAACPRLRYVGLLSTGYNIIDTAAASAHGITVCNVPDYSTPAVAQHTLALLLEICNQVGNHSAAVHAGRWATGGRWCFWDYPITELCGKTFGAVGFGSIGRATGRIAAALGMRVLACGSRPTQEGHAIARYVSQAELFAESDVVSLHCPLLPETQNLIRRENIEKMKDGVVLLNTARGGLVNEGDLAAALQSGKVAAAGLDVTAEEPMPPESPLATAPNCFITPHIAWVAKESRARLLDVVAQNLAGYLAGQPMNVVNP